MWQRWRNTNPLSDSTADVSASTTPTVASSAVSSALRISTTTTTTTTTTPVSTSSASPSTSDGSSAISDSRVSTTNIAGITTTTSSVGKLDAMTPYISVAGEATSDGTNHSSPPYGAVIGGALGGVAILCLTVLAVFLIRRKNASSGHGPPSYPTAAAQAQDSYYANGLTTGKWCYHPFQKPQGIPNDTAVNEAEANMYPAELPGR
ncbi:hypothetical protein EJ03DRAFT_97943 [Teratosphaeria nubilosa]|uniref:Uncharacterized protein n=1 Tax=Teratosphaeria nubilosa TaxID=161662 RepID=A0A6G1L8S7_9PEZI|nr:hypothetical protein EJ03DRAFT_97943 [Teratosphaeria nubilosa]